MLPVYAVVAAIPTGREIIYIKHSPFGMLHLEMVATTPTICRDGGEKDIKPKSAISERFAGRDARIFVSAMEPSADTTHFDTIIILRGRDVFGGTVAVGLKDGCLVGRKFLTSLDYIYATQMVAFFRTNPVLQRSDRLEIATLQAMAEAGNPPAQFYVGLMQAWGWSGITRDRKAAIKWLKLSAQQGFSPAMLALGLAFSGYGALEQDAAGPPRADEYTDLVVAYSWLNAARSSSERNVRNEASFRLKELAARMSQDELKRAEESLQKRSGAPK